MSNPVSLSGDYIVIPHGDARSLAKVVFAAAELAARHGARIDSRVLHLAEQINSASGISEQARLTAEHPYQYERIDAATAADILGCSPRNVRALATRGRLPGDKPGKQWWFNRDDVEVYRDFHDRSDTSRNQLERGADGNHHSADGQ